MTLKITNEKLDQFARMSDDEVKQVYDQLEATEVQELMVAFKARKEGRLVGSPEPIQTDVLPNRSFGDATTVEAEVGTPVITSPERSMLATRPNPYLKGAGATHNADVMSGADMTAAPGKREVSNAGIEVAQETIGKPIAGTIIEAMPEVSSPVAKVLGRDALTRIAGPGIQDYAISEADKARGEEQLANFGKVKVGPIETSMGDVARSVATEAGNPINLTPLGWEEKGAVIVSKLLGKTLPRAAPVLGKMAGAAAENAAIEVVAGTAVNDQNMGSRVGGAALGGALFRGGIEAGKGLSKWVGQQVEGVVKLVKDQTGTAAQVILDNGRPVNVPLTLEDYMSLETGWSLSKEDLNAVKGDTWHGAAKSSTDKYQKSDNLDSRAPEPPQAKESNPVNENKTGADRPSAKAAQAARDAQTTDPLAARATQDAPDNQPKEALVIRRHDGSSDLEVIPPTVKNKNPGYYEIGDHIAGIADDGVPVIGRVTSHQKQGKFTVTTPDGKKHEVSAFNARLPTEDEVLGAGVEKLSENPAEQVYLALRNNPKQNVKELAARAGMDLSNTRDMLGHMEDAGFVVKSKDGYWSTGKKQPKLSAGGGGKGGPPTKDFMKVMDREPPKRGKFNRGDYVYVEGRNDAHPVYVVEDNGTTAKVFYTADRTGNPSTIASKKLRSMDPPGVARIKEVIPEEAKLRGGLPEYLPTEDMLDLNLMYNNLKLFAHRESALQGVIKNLENQRHRGPKELQRFVKELQAADQHAKVKNQVMEAIRRAVPKKDFGQLLKDVHELALGRVTDEDMGQKYGQVWNEARAVVKPFIDEKNINDKLIEELGGIPEGMAEKRMDGLLDQYVARKYRAYLDPEGWAKNVPAKVVNDAVMRIVADNPKANWTEQFVARELSKIIHSAGDHGGFLKSGIGKKYQKSLQARKDIPKEIRALLGEIDNGAISLAETIGNQRAIIQNLKTWRDIVADERYFSPGPRLDMQGRQMVQVPHEKKRFGAAAGGYVDRDLWEGIQLVPQQQGWLYNFMRGLTGYMKGNEVGTFKAIYNSVIGNMISTAGMGKAGLDWKNGGADIKLAWDALKAYKNNPNDVSAAAIVKEAISYGAHWGGQLENELGFKKIFDAMDAMYNKPADNAFDVFTAMKNTIKAPYKGVRFTQEQFGKLLDGNDAVIRLANYISARRYYASQGLSLEEAARSAAKDINDVFWNAQNVGKWVETARSSGAGIVAKYLTAYVEDIRIWKNMSARLMTRPDTRFRVLGTGMAVGGAVTMARMAFGSDDDNFTKRQESWSPFMVPLPITEGGKRVYYDMTGHFPLARFAQGHPDVPLYRRVIANFITQPLEGGTGEGPVNSLLETTGLTRAFRPGKGPIEGDTGLAKTMEWLWKAGLVPKVVGNVANEFEKTRQHGIFPPTQGPGAAAARTVLPLVSEPANAMPKVMELNTEMEALKKDIGRAAASGRHDLIPGIIERMKFLMSQQQGK